MKKLAILSLIVCLLSMTGTAQAQKNKGRWSVTKLGAIDFEQRLDSYNMEDYLLEEAAHEAEIDAYEKAYGGEEVLKEITAQTAESFIEGAKLAFAVTKLSPILKDLARDIRETKVYLSEFLEVGKTTELIGANHTMNDVLEAIIQAEEDSDDEEISPAELDAAEHFLGVMKSSYPQNPLSDLTPHVTAKVLSILQ